MCYSNWQTLRQSKRMARTWHGRVELYENNNGKDGGHEVDDDKEVQYGICWSRRATSYHYQDSSSLSPAQIMEQEVYYQTAEDAIMECILLAYLIVLALAVYNHCCAMVDRWQRFGDAMADAVVLLQAEIKHIKNAIKNLLLVLTWMKAYGELALFYAEDLSIFVR
jgi:hypothetical protein